MVPVSERPTRCLNEVYDWVRSRSSSIDSFRWSTATRARDESIPGVGLGNDMREAEGDSKEQSEDGEIRKSHPDRNPG